MKEDLQKGKPAVDCKGEIIRNYQFLKGQQTGVVWWSKYHGCVIVDVQ